MDELKRKWFGLDMAGWIKKNTLDRLKGRIELGKLS